MCVKHAKDWDYKQPCFSSATHPPQSLAHLCGAAVAEGLLREAAAALDVLLPLEER